MNPILQKVSLGSSPGGRPPVALEITPEGVLAAVRPAAPGPGHTMPYAYMPLPPGALIPGIGEPNLRAPEAVANAIRSALGQLSPRTRAITLVLPDMVVRVFILEFDSLPGKDVEARSVLRFRLRKMVPFDVEHAGLTYQVLVQTKTECKVLAAIVPGPILAEYEAAVRAAGYEPGAVLPSGLAALEAIDSMEALLIANLSQLALTTSITNGRDLLLYRTLDLPEDDALRLDEVRRGIAVAASYYEDKLQLRPSQLYYAGPGVAHDFGRWIDNPELAVEDLAPRPDAVSAPALRSADKNKSAGTPGIECMSFAGVAGALAGAH